MNDTKKCVQCGLIFARKNNTSSTTWKRQRFCSIGCASIGKSRKKKPPRSKKCTACGEEFIDKSRDPKRWESRNACSMECAGTLRKKLTAMQCPGCKKEFTPTSRRAKYCCRKCAAKSNKGPTSQKGMHEKYARVFVEGRGRLLEHRWVMESFIGRALLKHESVHHKNGNTKDNRIENLELWFRGQPGGQRISDLIDFVVTHYREDVALRMSND